MINKTLGSYEIEDEIGQGGMATVYRAYQPNMDRYVAIKVIRRSIIEESHVRERFQREARLIARLEHLNLLPVYDFDGAHDPPYIVMRYLKGGTLKDVLASRQLPFDEIGYLFRQIGAALNYAHRQGVVHRDIKPSNIMIDQEGNAFVMDFGIARMMGRSGTAGITGTGAVVGTPDYISPEQAMGSEGVDLRADVYSLGVLLFQMTTGRLPFESDTPMAVLLKHVSEPVPKASKLNPELTEGFDRVITRAMAKEPDDRYQTVNSFVADAVRELGGVVASAPTKLRLAAQESLSLQRDRLAEAATPSGTDSQSTPGEQNKTVTALYADAAEYAEILDLSRGPEAARQAVHGLWQEVARIIASYGGSIFNQSERDLLALWGAESTREDDAERAVRAALGIRDTVQTHAGDILEEDEPLPIRIGVNTGLALLTLSEETGNYTATGATVSVASRLADNADGLVLITHDTFRQVQGVFTIQPDLPIRVRRIGGRAQIDTYRVEEAKPRAFRLQPRGVEGVETRMIGRYAELHQLQKAFFTAVEDSETQMVTVIGEAGLGKSRLLYEFASWSELRPEQYYIFRGRATPAMTSRPYALWRDMLSFRFEILDSDSPDTVRSKLEEGVAELIGSEERIAHLIGHLAGFDLTGSPHVTGEPKEVADRARRAVRRFFRLLNENYPVLMQLEDLHHADEAVLDLLAEAVSADEKLPLLVVAMARPRLYERRPTWGSGLRFHIRLELRPLDRRDSRELVSEILHKVDDLPRELLDMIVERSEGNPLYMEELVKMLVEDRVIQKLDDDHWTVESSRLEHLGVPPTLVGLLQARFDSLLYPEKLTLQRAAAIGRLFYDGSLKAIDAADDTHVDDLNGVLQSLSEREFIYPRETSAFSSNKEYIFGQSMLRDLILETLLKRQAQIYFRAAAEWLADQSGERASEYDALIADYYEKADQTDLAAVYLEKAGNTAVALSANWEGVALFDRALRLLDQELDFERFMIIQLQIAQIYSFSGDYDEAEARLQSVLKMAREHSDAVAEANALAQLGRIAGAWQGRWQEGNAYLEQALALVRELDDRPSLIFISRQLGNIAVHVGDLDDADAYLKESLTLARQEGDLLSAANALNGLGNAALSKADFAEALAFYEEGLALAVEADGQGTVAMITINKGMVQVFMGDYKAARESGKSALAMSDEIDTDYLRRESYLILGAVAGRLGQIDEARVHLDSALLLARTLGLTPDIVEMMTEYARLRSLTGDPDGALQWLGMARSHPAVTAHGSNLVKLALEELQFDLNDAEIEAALARGAKLDLDEMVAEILGGGESRATVGDQD
jgi:serine/threonine protein kinase/tetratricopeptide (TPR) repeat protein